MNTAEKIYYGHCAPGGVNLDAAVEAGMVPKDKLERWAFYWGCCRNARLAQWTGKWFVYIRHDIGGPCAEQAPHPQDDEGHDVFVPVEKAEPRG